MDRIDQEKMTSFIEEFARERKGNQKLQKYRDRNKEAQQGLIDALQKNALLKMGSDDLEEIFHLLKRTHVDGIQKGFAEKILARDVTSVRSDFIELLYGEMPFHTRYIRFKGQYKGFGVSNITCMLSLVFPEEHITVDKYSVEGLGKLTAAGMKPPDDTRELLDEKDSRVYSNYVGLCTQIRGRMLELSALAGADFTTVHELFYYLSTRTAL